MPRRWACISAGKLQIIFAYDKEKGNGIFVISYDAQTGQQLWETMFHEKANGVPLYLADNAGGFYVRNDFSGYQEPVFEVNIAYATFKGGRYYLLTFSRVCQ